MELKKANLDVKSVNEKMGFFYQPCKLEIFVT